MGRQSDERPVDLELRRLGICRSARMLADSLWGGETRALLFHRRQSSSGSTYPPRFFALSWRDDAILEFLRFGQCHQCPTDDSDSGAIHRSDLRSDAVATATTESS